MRASSSSSGSGSGAGAGAGAAAAASSTIRVLVAHTGRAFPVRVRPGDSVAKLGEWLAPQADIPTHEQILLLPDGVRLEPRSRFRAYPQLLGRGSSPSPSPNPNPNAGPGADPAPPEDTVFLYSRTHLAADYRPSLPAIELDAFEPRLPDEAAASSASLADASHPLNASNSVLVRTLPHYEQVFALHVDAARAYVEAGAARARACASVALQVQAQQGALAAAARNLEGHSRQLAEAYDEFGGRHDEQAARHAALLDEFETDLAALSSVQLHASLRRAGRTTLLDFVDEGRVRQWAAECREAHEQLARKVRENREAQREAARRVGEVAAPYPGSELAPLREAGARLAPLVARQEAALAALENDHARARGLVERLVREMRERGAPATNPVDAAGALEEQDRGHKAEVLPGMRRDDAALREVLGAHAGVQAAVARHYFRKLAAVSQLQGATSSIENRLAAYSAAMERQEKLFERFHTIKAMPRAYRAALAEVVRRRSFRALFQGESARMAERFTDLRSAEQPVREAFMQEFGRFLPDGLVPSLRQPPPVCEIVLRDTDSALPEVEAEDLADVDDEFRAAAAAVQLAAAAGDASSDAGGDGDGAGDGDGDGAGDGDAQQPDWLAPASDDPAEEVQRLKQERNLLLTELANLGASAHMSSYSVACSQMRQTLLGGGSGLPHSGQNSRVLVQQQELDRAVAERDEHARSLAEARARVEELERDAAARAAAAAEREDAAARARAAEEARRDRQREELEAGLERARVELAAEREAAANRAAALARRLEEREARERQLEQELERTRAEAKEEADAAAASAAAAAAAAAVARSASLAGSDASDLLLSGAGAGAGGAGAGSRGEHGKEERARNAVDLEIQLAQARELRAEAERAAARLRAELDERDRKIAIARVGSDRLMAIREELEAEKESLEADYMALRQNHDAFMEMSRVRLAYRSVAIGDLALFRRAGGTRLVAFQARAEPRVCLEEAEAASALAEGAPQGALFVGRVGRTEVVSEAKAGNAYGVPPGTRYVVVRCDGPLEEYAPRGGGDGEAEDGANAAGEDAAAAPRDDAENEQQP